MEFAFIIWAIGTLPSVSSGMCFILFLVMLISCGTWAVATISGIVDDNNEKEEIMFKKLSKLGGTVAIIAGVLWFFFLIVPNKETAYAMAAGYGVQSAVQNERVQKIAGQSVDVLEQYLTKIQKELEGQTKTQDNAKAVAAKAE
jgi:hypothetical protein